MTSGAVPPAGSGRPAVGAGLVAVAPEHLPTGVVAVAPEPARAGLVARPGRAGLLAVTSAPARVAAGTA